MTTTDAGTTPTRTLEQRRLALKHANEIRSHRANLKREVKAGRLYVTDLIQDPLCETMKVGDAIITQPKIGRVKRNRILMSLSISPSRSIGGLSERQRNNLVDTLAARL